MVGPVCGTKSIVTLGRRWRYGATTISSQPPIISGVIWERNGTMVIALVASASLSSSLPAADPPPHAAMAAAPAPAAAASTSARRLIARSCAGLSMDILPRGCGRTLRKQASLGERGCPSRARSPHQCTPTARALRAYRCRPVRARHATKRAAAQWPRTPKGGPLAMAQAAEQSVRRYAVQARSTDIFGRVLCSARDQHLVVDGPVQNGCPGEAITPAELFLSGVAACGVELVQVLAGEQRLPLRSVRATIEGLMDRSAPPRQDVSLFNTVRLQFHLQGVTEEQGAHLIERFRRR
jgi:uncharacterized OsmC-like protein